MLEKMENIRFKKWPVFLLIFTLAAGILGIWIPGAAYGKGSRTVKVAFFPMNGYHEKDADGRLTGMDVEYLDELCRFTDWDIE